MVIRIKNLERFLFVLPTLKLYEKIKKIKNKIVKEMFLNVL